MSPYQIPHKPLTSASLGFSSLSQCLSRRREQRGRGLRLRVVGHVREAFFADYLRQRLGAASVREGCLLTSTGPEQKAGDDESYDQVAARDGTPSCTNVYQTDHVRLVSRHERQGTLRQGWGLAKEGHAGDMNDKC